MTFWIYNFGLAVPVGEQNLKVRAKIKPLLKSIRSAGLHSREDETDHQIQKPQVSQSLAKPNPYQKAIQPTKEQSRHQIFTAVQVMSTPVMSLKEDTNISAAWQLFNHH